MLCIELIVLLLWFAAGYNSNVISIVLLAVILRHFYRRSFTENSYSYIMYIMVALILAEYVLAVLSLSSYNSPVDFPPNLTTNPNSTYPNTVDSNTTYYLDIPVYFINSTSV
jgi:beta-lactamase regulating signal transducer with metallopeptidase domain